MKKVLIYHNFSNLLTGGGDYLPLVLLLALQNTCEVTLALDMRAGFEQALRAFDVRLDLNRIKIISVMPKGYQLSKHNYFLSLYRFWKLKKLAMMADICISTINIMDFGKPAHHFIAHLNFSDDAFTAHLNHSSEKKIFENFKCLIREKLLRPLLGMRSKRQIIHDPREHIYPNSLYVENMIKSFYGDFNSTVFYPPTTFEFHEQKIMHNPLKVVIIGRPSPEKHIMEIIEIVEKARGMSGQELTLCIAGQTEKVSSYVEKLHQIAATRPWISFVGAMWGEDKERFLLSGTYAIHASKEEPFGIVVTEYLKAGLIPIVPDQGGTSEIVDSPELTYHTLEDGAKILVKLLTDNSFKEKQWQYCTERAKIFSKNAYWERQSELLNKIISL